MQEVTIKLLINAPGIQHEIPDPTFIKTLKSIAESN